MKFQPHIKATRREVTPRRLAAARRALARQADAVALFPDLQPTETPQQRCDRFDLDGVAMVLRWRDAEAARWRRARRTLRETLNKDEFRNFGGYWFLMTLQRPEKLCFAA